MQGSQVARLIVAWATLRPHRTCDSE